MTQTLRKTMLRATLRNVVKPLNTPATPLPLMRRMMHAASLVMRAPRGLAREETSLGGVPALKLVPRNIDGSRHLLYLHGGAYIIGSPQGHSGLAGQLGAAANMTVWSLDYRLAPEHPYPAAEQDALAAYRALLEQGIAAQDIAIAGDSAGGGLALATALAIRDTGLPVPAALALISPWADLTLSGRSMIDKLDVEPMLTPGWLEWAADAYCGVHGAQKATLRTHPGVSPLFGDFRGLPPMIIHAGSDEVLLDDAIGVSERAHGAGVTAQLRVFDGLWHVFQAQAGVLAEADESIAEIGQFLRWQR